jgi:hypothetical protein
MKITRYPRTSPAFAYASICLLPDKLQGSILGPWLAVPQVGLPPTKVRGIAKPQLAP